MKSNAQRWRQTRRHKESDEGKEVGGKKPTTASKEFAPFIRATQQCEKCYERNGVQHIFFIQWKSQRCIRFWFCLPINIRVSNERANGTCRIQWWKRNNNSRPILRCLCFKVENTRFYAHTKYVVIYFYLRALSSISRSERTYKNTKKKKIFNHIASIKCCVFRVLLFLCGSKISNLIRAIRSIEHAKLHSWHTRNVKSGLFEPVSLSRFYHF